MEEAAQVSALLDLSCHYGQGYRFCRPMPADGIERYVNALAPEPAA